MILTCPRCVGKVVVDTEFTTTNHIEFECLICGWRRIYEDASDPLIRKILDSEIKKGRGNSGATR